jgi:hypothetical protein
MSLLAVIVTVKEPRVLWGKRWLKRSLCLSLVCLGLCSSGMSGQLGPLDGSSGPGLADSVQKPWPVKAVETTHPQKIIFGKYFLTGNTVLRNPKSRFAIFVWSQDAAGTDIGILDTGIGDLPGPWRANVAARFWAKDWSVDAAFLSWSPEGDELVIACGDVFGNCGIYEVDLFNRKDHKIGSLCGLNAEHEINVTDVDWSKRKVHVTGKGYSGFLEIPALKNDPDAKP